MADVERLRGRVADALRADRSEPPRQFLRGGRPREDVDAGAEVPRHLQGEVSRSPEPPQPEAATLGNPGPDERPVADDARTQQRGGMKIVEPVGQRIRVGLGRDGQLGEATVRVPAGEARVLAQVLLRRGGRSDTGRTSIATRRRPHAHRDRTAKCQDPHRRPRPRSGGRGPPPNAWRGARRRGGGGRSGTRRRRGRPAAPRPAPAPVPGARRGGARHPPAPPGSTIQACTTRDGFITEALATGPD